MNSGSDTQNQAWAKDTGGFGFRMMAKMGWSEGKGLGKHEDGSSTHLRVKKRQENLALGAQTDFTGNTVLVSAVQDYNAILASLSTISSNVSGTTKTSSISKHMKRIAYNKVLKNKDASRYSASDMSAILGHGYSGSSSSGGSQFPVFQPVVVAPPAVPTAKRRRSSSAVSEQEANAPSVAAAEPPAGEDEVDEESLQAKREKAGRKLERRARREAGDADVAAVAAAADRKKKKKSREIEA